MEDLIFGRAPTSKIESISSLNKRVILSIVIKLLSFEELTNTKNLTFICMNYSIKEEFTSNTEGITAYK